MLISGAAGFLLGYVALEINKTEAATPKENSALVCKIQGEISFESEQTPNAIRQDNYSPVFYWVDAQGVSSYYTSMPGELCRILTTNPNIQRFR